MMDKKKADHQKQPADNSPKNSTNKIGRIESALRLPGGIHRFDAPPPVKPVPVVTNARERRLLSVLVDHGEVSRHDLDRLIGAENSPDVVMRTKRKHDIDIKTVKRPFIDRDGQRVRVGYYRIADCDRQRVIDAISAPA